MSKVLENSTTLSHFRTITESELLPLHKLVPHSITENVCATCLCKNDINGEKRKKLVFDKFIFVWNENLKTAI